MGCGIIQQRGFGRLLFIKALLNKRTAHYEQSVLYIQIFLFSLRFTIKKQRLSQNTLFCDSLSLYNHSVRSAMTGSFFAAFLDGIKPPIRVSTILSITKITEEPGGRKA